MDALPQRLVVQVKDILLAPHLQEVLQVLVVVIVLLAVHHHELAVLVRLRLVLVLLLGVESREANFYFLASQKHK